MIYSSLSFLFLFSYSFSQDIINKDSDLNNYSFIKSTYWAFDPDSKKYEVLGKYRDSKSTDGDKWFDEVSDEINEIGNGNYTITVKGDRLNLKEQTVIYVTKENKSPVIAEFLELKYSYGKTVEDYFDWKIENMFKIKSPDKKYKNETLRINFPEGIKINIPIVDGYLFELSRGDPPQNFSRHIGYYQSIDTIRNRKGKIRNIRKGEKKGFIIDVAKSDEIVSKSKNDIDGKYIGAGFYDSYKKSDIDKYVKDIAGDKKLGKSLMDSGLADVIFGVKDADVPDDYLKTFFKIYMYFFDVTMYPIADVTFTSLDGDTIAVALGMNDDCVGNIAIDINKWNEASNLEKYFIMFHELGHDIFNLSHSDGVRLMTTNQFNIKNENQLGEMLFEMFYHVEKMDIKSNCIKQ